MNNDITLLILAAGLGSRFGGLKQIEPIGPNGEFIIDYSIYDAIKAGFNKVVFLIKEENYDIFRDTIGKRVEQFVNVSYCFQKNDNIDSIPKDRIKPLGTAHAILCCKEAINEPFMIINADDFYGRDAFIKGAEFLKNIKENEFGMVAYHASSTLTENGSVKRGVCEVNNNVLTNIVESSLEIKGDKIVATPLNGGESFEIDGNREVSMNMLLFTPKIFGYIESKLPIFLNNNRDNMMSAEFLIPDVLLDSINENVAITRVIETSAKWYGVTYKEDKDYVVESIKKLIDNHDYPNNLWEK